MITEMTIVSAPCKRLYLYVTEPALFAILEEGKLKVSLPWATNDVTEGVRQGENMRMGEIERYGYICLSETCTSPAMWGYYADRSRGACIAFDIKMEMTANDNEWKILYPFVNNVEHFPGHLPGIFRKVSYGKARIASDNIHDILSIKSLRWQEEKEYRYIIKLSETDFEGYETSSNIRKPLFKSKAFIQYISAIILGVESSLRLDEIIGFIHKNELKTHIPADIDVVKIERDEISFDFKEPDFPIKNPLREYRKELHNKVHFRNNMNYPSLIGEL